MAQVCSWVSPESKKPLLLPRQKWAGTSYLTPWRLSKKVPVYHVPPHPEILCLLLLNTKSSSTWGLYKHLCRQDNHTQNKPQEYTSCRMAIGWRKSLVNCKFGWNISTKWVRIMDPWVVSGMEGWCFCCKWWLPLSSDHCYPCCLKGLKRFSISTFLLYLYFLLWLLGFLSFDPRLALNSPSYHLGYPSIKGLVGEVLSV